MDAQDPGPHQGHLKDRTGRGDQDTIPVPAIDMGDLLPIPDMDPDQPHLNDRTDTGELEAGPNQGHLKDRTDTGELGAGPDQGHLKDRTDTAGDLEAGPDQGHLKDHIDTAGDLEAGPDQGHLKDRTEKEDLGADPDLVHLRDHTDMADPDQGLGVGTPETATLDIIQGRGTVTTLHLGGTIPLGGARGEVTIDPGAGPGKMPRIWFSRPGYM